MKWFLSVVALLGLTGFSMNVLAQQTSAPQNEDDSAQPSQQTKAQTPCQTARSFEGTIAKSGDQFVLREATSQAIYGLDDQVKARQFQGKTVTIMATMDPATTTTRSSR